MMITKQIYMATRAVCLVTVFMSSLAAAVPHLSERNIVKAPSFTGATKWEQFAGKDPALDDNKDDDEDDSSAPPQLYAVAFWVINFFFLGYTIVCGTGLKQINKRLEPAVSSKAAYNQKLAMHRGLGWAALIFLAFVMLMFLFDVLLRTPKALTSKQEIILTSCTDANKSDPSKTDNNADEKSQLGQLPGANATQDLFSTQTQPTNALGLSQPTVSQTTTSTSTSSDEKKISASEQAIRDEREAARMKAGRSWTRHLLCIIIVWSLGLSSYVYGAAYLRPVVGGQITTVIGLTQAQVAYVSVGSSLMAIALLVGFKFRSHWRGQEEANPPLPPPPPPKTDAPVQPPPPVYAPVATAGETMLPATQPPAYAPFDANNNPIQYQPADPRIWGTSNVVQPQPSMIGQQPLMMGQQSSMMGQQPSMMGQQPSTMGQQPSMMGQQQSSDPARAYDNDYMVGPRDQINSFSRNAASQQSVSALRQQSRAGTGYDDDDAYAAPPPRKSIAQSVPKPVTAATRFRDDIKKVINAERVARSRSKPREASMAPATAGRKSVANIRAQSTAPVDSDNGLDFELPDDDAPRDDDDAPSDDQDGDDAPQASSDRRQTMTTGAARSTSIAPTSRIRKRSTSEDSSVPYDDDVADPASAAPVSAAPTRTVRESSRSAASVRSASMTPQPLSLGRKGAAAPPVPTVPEEDD